MEHGVVENLLMCQEVQAFHGLPPAPRRSGQSLNFEQPSPVVSDVDTVALERSAT
jgi:hypothetical protein